tara:strand:+ start:3340 stop:3891 length:552 start_codon:yes stop_codon:yes gene_type:complete
MDNVVLPIDDIVKNGLSINEYLILYSIANNNALSGIIDSDVIALVSLEKKGFIKISNDQLFLRDKASVFFAEANDLFVQWLEAYPVMVKKKFGGKRALSPANPDTILGKKLSKKWKSVFKKDTEAQKQAIRVLELEVIEKTKSGDLEYMVEAARWLNEGYHEKYSYLLDNDTGTNKYENEDYM